MGNIYVIKHDVVQVMSAGTEIWDVEKITIKADSEAEFLLMEVPMK
jgi:hypothetical protein